LKAEVMDKTLFQAAKGWVLYVCNKSEVPTNKDDQIHPQLQALCEEYADIFKELPGLPP